MGGFSLANVSRPRLVFSRRRLFRPLFVQHLVVLYDQR